MRIDPYSRAVRGSLKDTLAGADSTSPSGDFAKELTSRIQQVNQLQNQSNDAMAEASVKGATDIHETMIQMEEADISMRLLTKVRNKAIEAYHEVMRMQF